MKPVALIAVASGSNDIDVIVTWSMLKRLGMSVVVASAEGWSAVTLQNGLVIKPTCSIERVFMNRDKRPFDLLLLPSGDSVSVGRLGAHPKLAFGVRNIANGERYKGNKKQKLEEEQPFCVIASGGSARILHRWKLLSSLSSGVIGSSASFVKTWLVGEVPGSGIVHAPFCENNRFKIIICSAPSDQDPLRTVHLCLTQAREIMIRSIKEREREKFGAHQFYLLEGVRRRDEDFMVSSNIRKFVTRLRDHPWIPNLIRRFILSPVCASVLHDPPSSFSIGRLLPGLNSEIQAIEESTLTDVLPTDDSVHVVASSSAHILKRAWRFVEKSLRLEKKKLSSCLAAVLVTNRVNEQILAVLVSELRSKFGMLVRIIACDRDVLRTTDPYVITHEFLHILADAAVETVSPNYDVIITIDSEVDARGPGIWYRKSTFNWQDFEAIKKSGSPPYVSCVTASFDDDKGKQAFQSFNKKRLNPLTNEWITTESPDYSGRIKPPIAECTFFNVCHKTAVSNDRVLKERDAHDLVFQSFIPFHNRADLHTTMGSKSSATEAVDFARAVSDCLRHVVARRGYKTTSIAEEAGCTIQ